MAGSLLLLSLVLYWPITSHDFLSYDDPDYVTANAQVQQGLGWQGLKWACSAIVSCNWHPLTMLSHMLDCQLFGLKPWGHHLSSLLIHAVTSVLVFVWLQQMTGAAWRSLFVAALFAVHPLHVESVAWVAERKDLLSGFFGVLTLWAYARYVKGEVRSPRSEVRRTGEDASRTTHHASRFTFHVSRYYLLALCFFVLGLMSKPMLVTWPFVLLLLDYWPLGRFGLQADSGPPSTRKWQIVNRILWEKAPFFLIAAVFSVVTLLVQKHGGAVKAAQDFPLDVRCANALVSYCRYLGKLLWPTGLAVYYPHPQHWPLGLVLLAGGLLLGISVLLFAQRRRAPFLLVGWLWFCGTLVPVIGLVQVGRQAMADRYSYLPSLGAFILVVWGAYALTGSRRGLASNSAPKPQTAGQEDGGWKMEDGGEGAAVALHPPSSIFYSRAERYPFDRQNRCDLAALSVAGAAAVVACLALTRVQLGYWQDSEALFRHALDVTQDNYLAHNSLGTALDSKGRNEEAATHYREALRLRPSYAEAHYNLGNELARQGKVDEAIGHFGEALRLAPGYAEAHYNLGLALAGKGQVDDAISHFQAAVSLKPEYADAHFNLGLLFARQGQTASAIAHFQAAIRLKPTDADAHNYLGLTLARAGQMAAAVIEYQEAIRLKPDYAEAQANLKRALGSSLPPSAR